jgi:hypothetical protein
MPLLAQNWYNWTELVVELAMHLVHELLTKNQVRQRTGCASCTSPMHFSTQRERARGPARARRLSKGARVFQEARKVVTTTITKRLPHTNSIVNTCASSITIDNVDATTIVM